MTSPPPAPPPRDVSPVSHFSMIRTFHLADLFTIGNGFCGIGAIFASLRFAAGAPEWQIWYAAALIPLAIVFDLLDGRVARWRHTASAMGREMDSLADVISFGVAPTAIAWGAGLRGEIDQAILMFFAGCGLSRLARYNVAAAELADPSHKVRYFEGTPITFSLLPLGIVLGAHAAGPLSSLVVFGLEFHPIALSFVVSGALMISKTIRIPKP